MKYEFDLSRSLPHHQVQIIEFTEGAPQPNVEATYVHSDAFLCVNSSPFNANHIIAATTGMSDGNPSQSVSIFSFPTDIASSLKEECKLESGGGQVNSLFWESSDSVVVSKSDVVSLYSVRDNTTGPTSSCALPDCAASMSDPHRPFTVASVAGKSLSLWDVRMNKPSLTLVTSHFFSILSLDANPNLENVFVTGGSDGRMMFWDVRQPNGSEPLKCVDAHNHHVTAVKYNLLHDELVLSAGTDCAVNLWRLPSVSSGPTKQQLLVEPPKVADSAQTAHLKRIGSVSLPSGPVPDGLVNRYNRHEDSVYRCCWSAGGSSWTFASASYDGLVMLNSVPTSEKYLIMLYTQS